MKHWLLQAARINPYTHKVIWKATKEDGTPKTRTAGPALAKEAIRKSQVDGVQGDGYIHTYIVLDKEYEVPDDKRGIRRSQFKLAEPPPEPEIYTDSDEPMMVAAVPRATPQRTVKKG